MGLIEFEQAVLELEEVRIVIRAPLGVDLGRYNYDRKAANNASVTEWLDQRVRPLIGDFGVVVVDGKGATPHGRTKMSTLRESYER